jgi:DNA uptake protein ComE-like DNA-binding protein
MALFDWLAGTTPQTANWQTIRSRLVADPYYRLQSADEIAVAAELGIAIDVNQASVDDWLRLPGISIHQARSLVELTRNGVQFCCVEDIAAALGVSVGRVAPLQPLLSFCYYDAESPITPQPVDANVASVEQLTKVPAIDLYLARAIVQNRDRAGAYRNLADFQRRLSLPGSLISELMYSLRF